jgi:hypothetical protein
MTLGGTDDSDPTFTEAVYDLAIYTKMKVKFT